jgi:hypothetical protein
MPNLERAAIIELLGRLGSEEDAAVLEAARTLHRQISDSGMSWDDLLRQQTEVAGVELADDRRTPVDSISAEAAPAQAARSTSALPDRAEAARIIERLLARKGLSSNLREDLAEFKQMLADGSFDETDSRYLRALAKRLGI